MGAVWCSFIVGVCLTSGNMVLTLMGTPLIASPINCGALAGGNFPTAALGVVFRGLMETAYEAEPALTAPDSFSEEFKIFGFAIVFSLILIAIFRYGF